MIVSSLLCRGPVLVVPKQLSNKRHWAGWSAIIVLVHLLGAFGHPIAFAQGKTATATSVSITAGGTATSSVSSGTVVTLTATVTASGSAVTPGQVNFCDASAKYCTDIHLLGTAQLTSAGTATLKLRPWNRKPQL